MHARGFGVYTDSIFCFNSSSIRLVPVAVPVVPGSGSPGISGVMCLPVALGTQIPCLLSLQGSAVC